MREISIGAQRFDQIIENNYLIHDGTRKENIIHYGMAFRGKEAVVKIDHP